MILEVHEAYYDRANRRWQVYLETTLDDCSPTGYENRDSKERMFLARCLDASSVALGDGTFKRTPADQWFTAGGRWSFIPGTAKKVENKAAWYSPFDLVALVRGGKR